MSSNISQVHGANLKVNDLQKSVEWYADLLDIRIDTLDAETPFYVFDMDNGVNLMLDDYRNMQEQEQFPTCGFKTSNIDQAYTLAKENGISIVLDMQHPHPGLSYFYMVDSEENIVMIIQSDWVNPNPNYPTNPNHPIKNHLNNIIIPVTDLQRATEWYSKLLGQPVIPNRQKSGLIYWFETEKGTNILLNDNRNNQNIGGVPTFMLNARNIHDAFEFVKMKGMKIVKEIQLDQYFMIQDNEGNTIMICS